MLKINNWYIFKNSRPLLVTATAACLFYNPVELAAEVKPAVSSKVQEGEKMKRPDPERFAKAIEDFDKQDAEKGLRKGGIVFTGSSSIRLWNLDNAFSDLPVLNRGFGGSVANDLIHYFEKVVQRYEPKILVVYTGSNDINAKLTVQEAFDDYVGFLNLAKEKVPAVKAIVNPVKISRRRIEQVEQVRELNRRLKEWCEQRDWALWLETAAYLEDENGQPIDKFFAKDQLHLSPEGYVEWEKILVPVLKEEWAKVSGK